MHWLQLDAIGVWTTPWAERVMLEGNRFWFYSLCFSILWGVVGLFSRQDLSKKGPGRRGRKADGVAVKGKMERGISRSREGVKRRLVSDCFDLLIPGHVTGWISTSTATVGFASVVSTVLSSKDIWDRLQDDL
jgi:hypothetical protein